MFQVTIERFIGLLVQIKQDRLVIEILYIFLQKYSQNQKLTSIVIFFSFIGFGSSFEYICILANVLCNFWIWTCWQLFILFWKNIVKLAFSFKDQNYHIKIDVSTNSSYFVWLENHRFFTFHIFVLKIKFAPFALDGQKKNKI